ncbi:MAG: hypothetical protein ACE5E6_07670 [Phycisphaerae bacterium]
MLVASVWYPVRDTPWLAAASAGVAFGLFLVAVRGHRVARATRTLFDRLLTVAGESARRAGGHVTLIRSWQRPETPAGTDLDPIVEDGPVWTLTEQERRDLDLFAPPVGMFGLLNRTSTAVGARRLRDMIDHPCLSSDCIEVRRAAVQSLEQRPERRLRIMAAIAGLREHDDTTDRLIRAVRRATPLRTPWPLAFMRTWSLLSALLTVTAVVQAGRGRSGWGTVCIIVLMLNTMYYLRMRAGLTAALAPWRNLGPVATAWLDASRRTVDELSTDDLRVQSLLSRLRACMTPTLAKDAWPRLRRSIGWADVGGVFHVGFNIVFFYDVHVAAAILGCVVPRRATMLTGLAAMGEVDALSSLACFAWEQPTRCYPGTSSQPGICLTAARHPLIPPDTSVPNDVALDQQTRLWIITGSNMAGKSTLLRTLGINTLLAQWGTAAVAQDMTWMPVRLVTDLQAADNLADKESYFLAEVRHVRRMVDPPPADARLLGLIDEPFRGTNTAERVAASVAVVEHLLQSQHFFVVATHEPGLTQLADGAPARNFHFRETLDGSDMVFDYRLRQGPARARNALLVLEQEGYPPAMLVRARQWLKQG